MQKSLLKIKEFLSDITPSKIWPKALKSAHRICYQVMIYFKNTTFGALHMVIISSIQSQNGILFSFLSSILCLKQLRGFVVLSCNYMGHLHLHLLGTELWTNTGPIIISPLEYFHQQTICFSVKQKSIVWTSMTSEYTCSAQ
jgi:hypothetical protein